MTAAADLAPTLDTVDHLAPTLDMADACELLGISTWTGYELVKRNEFPVDVLRLGRKIRIPTRPLLERLGIHGDLAAPPISAAS